MRFFTALCAAALCSLSVPAGANVYIGNPMIAWGLSPMPSPYNPLHYRWIDTRCDLSGEAWVLGCDGRNVRAMVVRINVRQTIPQVSRPQRPKECSSVGGSAGGIPEDTVGMLGGFAPKAHCSFAYQTYVDNPVGKRLVEYLVSSIVPATVMSVYREEKGRDFAMAVGSDALTLVQYGPSGFIPTPMGIVIGTTVSTAIGEMQVVNMVNAAYDEWKKGQ